MKVYSETSVSVKRQKNYSLTINKNIVNGIGNIRSDEMHEREYFCGIN